MKIQGKTALITGASRGIGRAIALEFARQGASCLLLVARNPQGLDRVAEEVRQANPQVQAIPICVDLSQMEAVKTAISQGWREYGPIHILVNNAGVAHQTSFLQSQLHQAQTEINVNLLGTYNITRLVAQRMAAQQEGTIVNVSSLMGKLAAPTFATYCATKFALVGLTQALRSELAAYNLRVVALLPSLTETDMVQNTHRFNFILPTTPEKVARALVAGLRRGSVEILVGWQSHAIVLLNRIVPWLAEKIVALSAPRPDFQVQESYKFSFGQGGV